MNRDDILKTVERLIGEVAGEEILLATTITPATSFNADLELEGLELVALAEKLQQHYGAEIDFVGWISQKSLDEIIALTVGDLVELIACRT